LGWLAIPLFLHLFILFPPIVARPAFAVFFSGAYVSSPDSYHDLIIHYSGIFVVEDHVVTL
jgi:hypothetical protein